MRFGLMSAGAFVAGVLSLLFALNGVTLPSVEPKADAVAVGALAFLSCVMGMMIVHAHEGSLRAEKAASHLMKVNFDLERVVAERTRALCEKVAELEKARAAAVEADAAKSRFLATMSHELRTPLNAILGFSELIKREMFGPAGDARYVDYASHIHDSGFHLLSLIRDILDLSKIEAGKMEIECEALEVGEIVEEARKLAGDRGGHTVTAFVPDDLPLLYADKRAALQMLLNLLSNAMKFTPASGAIAVTAGAREDGGITLNVRDSGAGISREDIPKALSPYCQVTSAIARQQDGTGLGLPIVQALMTLHGGRLQLESEPGQGTCVSLQFPAERSVRDALETKAA